METPGLIWTWGLLFSLTVVNGSKRYCRPVLEDIRSVYAFPSIRALFAVFLNIALRFSESTRV